MASSKREHPQTGESEAKRAKNAIEERSDPIEKLRVALNPADCNLDFNIEGGSLIGHALFEEGFAYCWSGARANVGISGGKYCFGCKIISNQHVVMEDTPPDQQHLCRIGISRGDELVGNLGEGEHSYGFGGTGKFSNGGRFSNFGETFGVGDTIVCTVDLESKPRASIGFSKNGKSLGIAKHFDAGPSGLAIGDSSVGERQYESRVFPHVLLKNVVVQMQFSIEDGLVPEEGYKPWASATVDRNAIMGPSLSEPKNCEVIMMVGLPASGKSTWAEKWVKEHPEKRYVLLGTNLVLDQMKVPGLLRKRNYGERFDRLMDRATGIFNTLLSRASRTPRNYIIDQTNVYKSARKRKLKPFAIYRKIAVVIFPNSEELKVRSQKRLEEMGKEVPPEAVNEMIANYVLPKSKDMPGSDEYFDLVMFPELNRATSQRYLDEMKRALVTASTPKSTGSHSIYSRESCVHSDPSNSPYSLAVSARSHNSPLMQGQGGSWQGSSVPQAQSSFEYQYPSHAPGTHKSPVQPGRLESYSGPHQGSINAASARDDAYQRPYSSYGRSYLPRDDPPDCRGYGSDPFMRHDVESRNVNAGGGLDLYYSHGISSGYVQPESESRSFASAGAINFYGFAERSVPYQLTHETGGSTAPYSSHGGYASYPGDARPDFPPSREHAFQQSSFSGPYGSPYGTPDQRPYGNFAADAAYSQGSH
ncbi:hypothetical protein Nepgr_028765 [Nepenthes gracilis]|uniref:SPRY domain-containing protein n=1 Tax=Nepenthes gracilis TaxID=150966 RepID=A0AAD3Y2E3_NEPGR|nr:hypothetical protein Nepgr_028765 [Nepenthes gracilis]